MSLYLVVPTYNEGPSLIPFLTRLAKSLKEQDLDARLVVVDDGSDDQTADELPEFENSGIYHLLRHDRNLGVGAGLETGFRYVLEHAHPDDLAAVIEADGTNDHTLLGQMCETLENGYDVVIASRMAPKGEIKGFPLLRRFFSNLGNLTLRLAVGYPGVRDYTVFFRAYRIDALKAAWQNANGRLFAQRGFEANCELLFQIASAGGRVTEIPFAYRYDLKQSASKMRIGQTIAGYLNLILRYRAPIRNALLSGRSKM